MTAPGPRAGAATDVELALLNLERLPALRSVFCPERVRDAAEAAAAENRAPHPLVARLADIPPGTFEWYWAPLFGGRCSGDLGHPLGPEVTVPPTLRPPPPPGCGMGSIASLEHLVYLDRALALLGAAGQRIDGYAKKMKNPDQFWDTVSEIAIVAPFAYRCKVMLDPPAGSRRLDAAIRLGPQRVLFEVLAPHTWEGLHPGKARKVTSNRLAAKILDKAKGQIPAPDPRGDPIVVAVDTGGSEIGWWSPKSLLLGPPIHRVTIDRGTGMQTGASASRDGAKSLHCLDARTDSISAIAAFRRVEYAGPAVAVRGEVACNPHAAVPLAHEARGAIERVLRGAPPCGDGYGSGGR